MSTTSSHKHIYKILPTAPPNPLPAALPRSDLDKNDGFIHLSTNDQVPITAGRFFSDHTQLWILKIEVQSFLSDPSDETVSKISNSSDSDKIDRSHVVSSMDNTKGYIKWEASGDHGIFPHLYDGDLGRDVVKDVLRFERSQGPDALERWEDILGNLES